MCILLPMWDLFTPDETRWYRWRLDGAIAYLRKNGDEWRTAFAPVRFQDLGNDSGGPEPAESSADADASFTVAHGSSVALRPRMSERPYLVVSRNDVLILGGAEARFEGGLPAMFRFELGTGDSLGESLPYHLSSTWFGDKTSGVLCWSLPTALDPRCCGETLDESHDATEDCRSVVRCEIVVRNDSKTPLELKRLAVYTDLLNIYEAGGRLETDTVRVDGLADGGLHMRVEDSPAAMGRKLLTPARVGQRELFVRRGVNFLRSVTGM